MIFFFMSLRRKTKKYKGTMPENMLRIGINILININKLNRYNATNIHIL